MILNNMTQLQHLWKRQNMQIKLRAIRTCVFPIALYGCERWTLSTTNEKQLSAFEMKCYRRILRIRIGSDSDILRLLNIPSDSLLNLVKARKLKIFWPPKKVIKAWNGTSSKERTMEREEADPLEDGSRALVIG